MVWNCYVNILWDYLPLFQNSVPLHFDCLFCMISNVVFTENVSRLKQLEYLNLALNNIERIENLEGNCFLILTLFILQRLRNKLYNLY